MISLPVIYGNGANEYIESCSFIPLRQGAYTKNASMLADESVENKCKTYFRLLRTNSSCPTNIYPTWSCS